MSHSKTTREAYERMVQEGADLPPLDDMEPGAVALLGSLKVAPAWRDICKAFENKKVRKRHPGWAKTIEQCALFCIEREEVLTLWPGELHIPDVATIAAPLPFPETAVLSKERFCIGKDFWLNEELQQAGGSILTGFDLDKIRGHRAAWIYSANIRIDLIAWAKMLRSNDPHEEHNALFIEDASHVNTLTIKGKHVGGADVPEPNHATLLGGFGTLLAFKEHIHQPGNFIVKNTPEKMRKPLKGKIPRMHSRPTYIVVDKAAITRRYAAANPGIHKSPVPHLRRGHYRTLASNRYKEPGKRVWVRATHVKGNDVEWREGDRHYKVI